MNIAKHSESTGLQGEKISRFQVEDSHVFIDLIEIEEGEFDLVVTLNVLWELTPKLKHLTMVE